MRVRRVRRVVGGIVAAVVTAVIAVVVVIGIASPDVADTSAADPGGSGPPSDAAGPAASPARSPSRSASGSPSASPGGGAGRGASQARAFGKMDSYLGTRRGSVTAAVEDLRTGRTWKIGGTGPQTEASVVKLDILEALLADSPNGLTANGQALARKMITVSDNDAATALWNAADGATGIGAYNAKAGLSHTKLSACVQCPGFPWPGWGLSRTTAADQLALLRQLVTPGALLSPTARGYARTLLENVDAAQRWGVTGGVPAAATVALKNGWLPLDDESADWQVNSVGWVSGEGRDYLIAVLSTGNPTQVYGQQTIDGLSARVWAALAP